MRLSSKKAAYVVVFESSVVGNPEFAPNEQKTKPIESISICSVHSTLNLPKASRLLGMTKGSAALTSTAVAEGWRERRSSAIFITLGWPLAHQPFRREKRWDPAILLTESKRRRRFKLCHPDPDFLHVAPSKTACAAFSKKSRMRFANANKLHRKSGGAKPRDLQFSQSRD
jgi:hypothetical protein